MISYRKRLNRVYQEASVVSFSNDDKIILFSDCHRGDNSYADDFANNRNIYYHALKHYYEEGFTYIELGDGDELWENVHFKSIFEAHKNVFLLMKKFFDANRLHMVWGNHDMVYSNPRYVKKYLSTYFEPVEEINLPLFPGLTVTESLILYNPETHTKLLLIHGHQADTWNYVFWKWSRFLVRILWKPLNIIGISDPTSPAKNYQELIRIERRIKRWISENNRIPIIAGHTHRPRFPNYDSIPFFNTGSCVHPRSITGLEIENGQITLIKWDTQTTPEGLLQIVRTVLEGPRELARFNPPE